MIKLKEETLKMIVELELADWFCNVGKVEQESVKPLSSWKKAEASCLSSKWENVQLDAINELTTELFVRDKHRYNSSWNEIVDAAKLKSEPLIASKAREIILDQCANGEDVLSSIRWDVINAVMEVEYSDVYEASFYRNLMAWYKKGHFPCGWEGKWPKGQIVIY